MLNSFLQSLKGEAPASETPDPKTAVAALLVHAARSDEDYTETEEDLIEAILAHLYNLRADEAENLRKDGETADETAVDNFRFGQVIRDNLPESDRITVIEGLWSVVLSDETRDPNENEMVRRVVKMLDVEPRESVLARQRVETAMKG